MKPLDCFFNYKRSRTGKKPWCKECTKVASEVYNKKKIEKNPFWYRDRMREYKKTKPDILKNAYLKREYGIGLLEYNYLFEKQSGRCAICGIHQSEISRALSVDHNHNTNKVRALLCTWCNSGLGNFNESIALFNKAIRYLELHNTVSCE